MMFVRTVTPSVKKQGLRRQQHIRTTKERQELGRQGEAGVGKAASHNNGGFGYAGL